MQLDAGSGREDGTGAYAKLAGSGTPHQGAVYAVAGSSGKISGGTLDHAAMYVAFNQLGSVVLDIDGGRLEALFLDDDGTVLLEALYDLGKISAPGESLQGRRHDQIDRS